MGDMYKNSASKYNSLKDNEKEILGMSSVIENAPYELMKDYKLALSGDSTGQSSSSSHSSNSSSSSASGATSSKNLEDKL